MPQRQISAVSQLSVQPTVEPQAQVVPQPLVLPSGHVVGAQTPTASPRPQITPERAVSPEPPVEPVYQAQDERTVVPPASQAPPTNIIVQQPIQSAEENIYDATPRTSVIAPRQIEPSEHIVVAPLGVSKAVAPIAPANDVRPPQNTVERASEPMPQQHIVVNSAAPVTQPEPQPATQVVASTSNGNGNVTPPKSTSADIFEEAKRKMLLREQEEKIPVFPTEPDIEAAANQAAKKKATEEAPQMSATSYPGQEWNPYGEFDSWEE